MAMTGCIEGNDRKMKQERKRRIIVLIDMDCFYVQVEQRAKPELKGQPCAVVQYNQWQGGGIIAVGYEARAHGVKRGMRGDQARTLCPHIHLLPVPCVRGKADLTKYREASGEVIAAMTACVPGCVVERASIDEAYVDIGGLVTEQMLAGDRSQGSHSSSHLDHLLGETRLVNAPTGADWLEQRGSGLEGGLDEVGVEYRELAWGAHVASRIRSHVVDTTGFTCSAGIANNKTLAKLACGLHKPNQQTLVDRDSVQLLFQTTPIKKVRNLGGKLGEDICENLNIQYMQQLADCDRGELARLYGHKTAQWLHELSTGTDHEPVTARLLAQSIGCGKNFPGKQALDTVDKVKHWLSSLSEELATRVRTDTEKNARRPQQLSVGVKRDEQHHSRQCVQRDFGAQSVATTAYRLLANNFRTAGAAAGATACAWSPAIQGLSLCASKFVDVKRRGTAGSIDNYMLQPAAAATSSGHATTEATDATTTAIISTTDATMGIISPTDATTMGILSETNATTMGIISADTTTTGIIATDATATEIIATDVTTMGISSATDTIMAQTILANRGAATSQDSPPAPTSSPNGSSPTTDRTGPPSLPTPATTSHEPALEVAPSGKPPPLGAVSGVSRHKYVRLSSADIDSDVLRELPIELRRELHRHFTPSTSHHKRRVTPTTTAAAGGSGGGRGNGSKRCTSAASSISKYFKIH